MDGNESFGEGIQKKSRWKSQGSKGQGADGNGCIKLNTGYFG